MKKRNETVQAIDTVIITGTNAVAASKKFIRAMEVLLLAAIELRNVLTDENGGGLDE